MEQEFGSLNSLWCGECNRHSSQCECDPPQHIYLVEYKLMIAYDPIPAWCQERVRCIAFDEYLAMKRVATWAMTTEFIWWHNEEKEQVEHRVPAGPRDVTIVSVTKYAENVGSLLKQCPLPEIFSPED